VRSRQVVTMGCKLYRLRGEGGVYCQVLVLASRCCYRSAT
jgi:hypothetical protein